jgi:hypothetical protein
VDPNSIKPCACVIKVNIGYEVSVFHTPSMIFFVDSRVGWPPKEHTYSFAVQVLVQPARWRLHHSGVKLRQRSERLFRHSFFVLILRYLPHEVLGTLSIRPSIHPLALHSWISAMQVFRIQLYICTFCENISLLQLYSYSSTP